MSNPFKAVKNKKFEYSERERQERQSNQVSQNNRPTLFKQYNAPHNKVYYEMNITDFPELNSANEKVNPENPEKCLMNFKNASLKEAAIIEEEEYFEPGWLYMKCANSTNQIMRKFIPVNNNMIPISFQDKLNMDMNNCIQKIEERRKTYIEYYGEDNYERDYHMEDYEEMSYKYNDGEDAFDSDEDY
jgi:hypothetical protein